MWVRLACAIGFQRLHLLRWRVHQRFELDKVVAPPSLPSALRAFERDFLSRAGFGAGARDWERFLFLDGSASQVDCLCVGGFVNRCWIPLNGSFVRVGQDLRHGSGRKVARFWSISSRQGGLVSLYWIAFLSAPTAQQPALEIQPREDIRRCRGDE
ncbi:BQ5605_C056g12666 [Microbotryum silenes-dioicae]|uniref:BQ5605_C056g12666 protein n=1 Tax=Microbotryum silenes-dioicae TaxID=796604 RepID=A0A2X0MNV2_9BASI|nr:BQ5605_C056g12666 [Microbotryum silenes-dioicae]